MEGRIRKPLRDLAGHFICFRRITGDAGADRDGPRPLLSE
jgi:hypothetical protein